MKTKIVATIGPACSSPAMLRKMMMAGVDVFRLNCSHSKHDDMEQVIREVDELNRELDLHVAILADLQGPKIRIGEMENGEVMLYNGDHLTITTKECICSASLLYISYPNFPKDVKPGEFILLDDGKLMLSVDSTNYRDEVRATVVHGGPLSSRKGINLPDTVISLPSLTEKDHADLEFIIGQNVQWIALSFVRSANDIIQLRQAIQKLDPQNEMRIIAKMEKPQAIAAMDEIIEEADAVMVARGDLGVEMPLEQVPLIQKMLVSKCNMHSKPVIIATQMMEGMIMNIRPTRAEVNDVANSVVDGADALMLSGETSVGQYPIQVVETMVKIIEEAENYPDIYHKRHQDIVFDDERFISDSVLISACEMARHAHAKAIIAMTHTGYSAFKLSGQRPNAGIFIFSNDRQLLRALNLVWGITPFYYDNFTSIDRTLEDIRTMLRTDGFVNEGDLLINVASTPIYVSGKTNMLKLSYA
jgi:pyruvate kinase